MVLKAGCDEEDALVCLQLLRERLCGFELGLIELSLVKFSVRHLSTDYHFYTAGLDLSYVTFAYGHFYSS